MAEEKMPTSRLPDANALHAAEDHASTHLDHMFCLRSPATQAAWLLLRLAAPSLAPSRGGFQQLVSVPHRLFRDAVRWRPEAGHRATTEGTEPRRNDQGDGDDVRLDAETRLRKIEEELRFRVGLEALVTSMSTRLLGVHLDELPAVVEDGLGQLGRYFGVDRAYTLKVDENFVFDLNVEWWADDVPHRTTAVFDLPVKRSASGSGRCARAAWSTSPTSMTPATRHRSGRSVAARRRAVDPVPVDAGAGERPSASSVSRRRTTRRWSEESITLMRTVGHS